MQKVHGLTHEKVKEQLQKYGENVIEDKNKATWDKILIRQFKDNKIVYLLIVSVILSSALGEILTAVTISLVIFLVIVVGFIQEYKAEQAVQALRNMTKSFTRVFRNGKVHEIESSQLVPQDCITLRSGDIVPADCLIVEGKAIHINESVLTGESQEVIKDKLELYTGEHDLMTSEESHRLYMGTMILKGKCTAIVTHTGMNTKIGGIAHLIEDTEKKIMLTGKVNRIINFMIFLGVSLGIFSSFLLVIRASQMNSAVIVEIILFFIAFTVSAFPEAIPVVMMATFTTGARRMAGKNVIVNRMGIIETLGEVNVICADKTGTLTKGQMTVQEIITDGKQFHVTGSGFSSNGKILHQQNHTHATANSSLHLFLKTVIICNDSSIHTEAENTDFQIVGSATEGALLIAAHKGGLHTDDFDHEILEELPFDSERKMMSVIVKEETHNSMYSKGAPEVLLQKCSHIHTSQGIQPLSELGKKHLLEINELLGHKGMRTIACGYKSIPHGHTTASEHELVFLGLAAMEDAPHEQAAQAVLACQTAGISVKMITGDQAPTALSIAKQVGIHGRVITGAELENLSDSELAVQVKDIGIFARVKPEHKYRIVKALKDNGYVVVMTGDGVNDAPALKEAHVGIAMGRNGTDVTRSVADLTLKDDNFASIVSAIHEGRVIFKNVRKFIGFQLSCSIAEISTIFVSLIISPFFGWTMPIVTSIQILFMNLVTDDVPAIALGQTSADPYIMHEKPRQKGSAAILSRSMIALIATLAMSMTLFTFGIQYVGTHILKFDSEIARTTTMVGFIMIQLFTAFQFRSFRKGFFNDSIHRNIPLIYAVFISIGATLLIVYTPLSVLFETHAIGWSSWIVVFIATLAYLIYLDLIKFFYNIATKRTHLARIR